VILLRCSHIWNNRILDCSTDHHKVFLHQNNGIEVADLGYLDNWHYKYLQSLFRVCRSPLQVEWTLIHS
jgi:hypothetical protein